MEWDIFYDRFFDWSDSTRTSRISSLTSFGPSKEVIEVALELYDEKVTARFLKKALDAGVRFEAGDIADLVGIANENPWTSLC